MASDPFGAAPKASPSKDPFSGRTVSKGGPTAADPFAFVTSPSPSSSSVPRKKSHRAAGLTDFLTGSPLRGGSSSSGATAHAEGSHSAAKEKKKHKWVPKLGAGGGGGAGGKHEKSPSSKKVQQQHAAAAAAANLEDARLRVASEASRRAEDERQRRLALQEEQDLAYAIALSKAEAESIKK